MDFSGSMHFAGCGLVKERCKISSDCMANKHQVSSSPDSDEVAIEWCMRSFEGRDGSKELVDVQSDLAGKVEEVRL